MKNEKTIKQGLFIFNEVSGSIKINKIYNFIFESYQRHGILLTPISLTEIDRKLLSILIKENKYSLILLAGGDGTIRNFMTYLLDESISIPIGIIPTGTCNDLANSLGIPKNVKKAALLPLLNHKERIDIGRAGKTHYFFSSLGAGFITALSYDTTKNSKRNFKQYAYYLKAALSKDILDSYPVKIYLDDEIILDDTILLVITTGSQVAGFKNILKDASLFDGKLDLFLIRTCNYLNLAQILYSIMTGKFINNKYVLHAQSSFFRIEAKENIPIVLDGDKSCTFPLNIETITNKIEFFTPLF